MIYTRRPTRLRFCRPGQPTTGFWISSLPLPGNLFIWPDLPACHFLRPALKACLFFFYVVTIARGITSNQKLGENDKILLSKNLGGIVSVARSSWFWKFEIVVGFFLGFQNFFSEFWNSCMVFLRVVRGFSKCLGFFQIRPDFYGISSRFLNFLRFLQDYFEILRLWKNFSEFSLV